MTTRAPAVLIKEIIASWGDGLLKECNVFLLPWQDKINIDRGDKVDTGRK